MPTATITIESLIADHGERLEQALELDGLASKGPEEFVDDLGMLSVVLLGSISLTDVGTELASAITYLLDALALDDNDPDRQVLFRKADSHLDTVADLM